MTNLIKMINILFSLSTLSGFGKFILSVISFILALFTPVRVFYHMLLVFLSLNFITGVWDDLKHGRKFSWAKFKIFITRIFLYMLAVSATWLFELIIINEFVGVDSSRYLTTVVSGMFALYEIQSFFCNCANISDNKIFIKISEKIKNIFDKKSKVNEKESDSDNINIDN